ncbi:MAG: SH3 domain-containing protein, partial [Chloroflexota bacterium]
LEMAALSCEDLASGTLCYGNSDLDAEPQPTTPLLQLNVPGDRENLTAIRSLRLSVMDEINETWGVALMEVRAIGEAVDTPQDVTIVLFGDVELDNAVSTQSITASSGVNIRAEPSQGAAILETTASSQALIADGRTGAGDWLRVRLPDNPARQAWISTGLITSDTDVALLPVIEPDASSDAAYNEMQAFYFSSGADDALCDEAPDSGLLLQTPEGTAEFTMLLNEVNIQLESTAYVQASPGGDMIVFAVSGDVVVESDGVSRVAVPGTQISVPLDANGAANGEPGAAQPYDSSDVAALPTGLLADQIAIAPPADIDPGKPIAGNWLFQWGIEQGECPGGQTVSFSSDVPQTSIEYAADGETLLILLTRYRPTGTGVYETVFTDSSGNLHRHTITVTASDRISGTAQITYLDNNCTLDVPFNMVLISQP